MMNFTVLERRPKSFKLKAEDGVEFFIKKAWMSKDGTLTPATFKNYEEAKLKAAKPKKVYTEDQIKFFNLRSGLRKAAERCEFIDKNPASEKQINFLANLMIKAGEELQDLGLCITNTSAVLTAGLARNYIGMYLRD